MERPVGDVWRLWFVKLICKNDKWTTITRECCVCIFLLHGSIFSCLYFLFILVFILIFFAHSFLLHLSVFCTFLLFSSSVHRPCGSAIGATTNAIIDRAQITADTFPPRFSFYSLSLSLGASRSLYYLHL